jgi:hypothetical protein
MDRQDIDALLVGALYGELTPADEARLAAHLEAHPGDRGALDDLKSARAKVRESRIFEDAGSSGGVIEPPQHISALLLQEAHRRAPKRAVATDGEQRDSWFFRVTRMFLAHPAMAAAAMLVLVIGVASTVYTKKGANYADRTAPQSESAYAPRGADQTVAAPTPAEAVAQGSAAYAAQLADPNDLAEGTAAERWDNEKKEENAPAAVANAKPKAEPSRRRAEGIEVSTEQQQPKEYVGAKDSGKLAAAPAKAVTKGAAAKNDAYRDSNADADGAADDRAGMIAPDTSTTTASGYGRGMIGGAASGGGGAPSTGAAQPSPPPPPPPSAPSGNFAAAPKQDVASDKKTATVTKTPPSTTAPTSPTSPAPTATPQDSTLISWAKSTHAQVIAKVKSGDCQAAAKLALTVSNRAPEYYSQYMATDRQLKSCKQYIDNERDKDAEKANKTRAQKRVNADEAAPAPSTK